MIYTAAREDLHRLRFGQADLLSTSVVESLELLLAAPHNPAFGRELDLELRPRFRDVGHDFVSHHTDSVGAGALLLVKALELRGRTPWVAQKKIAPPMDWNDALLPAIETCGEFLLLMNTPAAQSPRVKGEVQHAVDHGRRILAVALEHGVSVERFDIGLKATQVRKVPWYRPLLTEGDASELAEEILRELQKEKDLVTGKP